MDENMLRENILNMPAGNDMNALIAENVLAAHRWNNDDGDYDGEYPMFTIWDEVYLYPDPDNGYLFTPSEDMPDAWDAFEKIASTYECETTVGRNFPYVRGEYRAEIHGGKLAYCNPSVREIVFAETAPLAMCRCMLLVVMDA